MEITKSVKRNKIIVAGAGASGLIAALELSKAGFEVTILEAQNRIGGRIHTIIDDRFPIPVELGAEFIHGNYPVTFQLLKEFGIKKTVVGGKFFTINKGEYEKNVNAVLDYHHELENALENLEKDITVEEFLQNYFPEPRYEILRKSVNGFVRGYDTGDPRISSIQSFKEEWLGSEEDQYRIEGGYVKLVDALAKECLDNGCKFEFNKVVNTINWKSGSVEVHTADNNSFSAEKIVITFSLGIWKKSAGEVGGFTITPELPDVRKAVNNMGFGQVIKFVLLFDDIFWNDELVKKWTDINTSEIGFIISNAEIPTWWTQMPAKLPMLTGWFGGSAVLEYSKLTDKELLERSVESLEKIFGMKPNVKAFHVVNWSNEVFSGGSYSYSTVNVQQKIDILKTPIEDTIFIAGEAVYTGEGLATVEAALASGIEVAKKIAKI